jgi:hypothetical protein
MPCSLSNSTTSGRNVSYRLRPDLDFVKCSEVGCYWSRGMSSPNCSVEMSSRDWEAVTMSRKELCRAGPVQAAVAGKTTAEGAQPFLSWHPGDDLSGRGLGAVLRHPRQPIPLAVQAGRDPGARTACSCQEHGAGASSDSSKPPMGSPHRLRGEPRSRTAHLAHEAGSG